MEIKPSTEQLLELLKYYTADSLKAEQTKLTKAANQARDVANGKLGVLFSAEERETLLQAAMLMRSLKSRVERAKEVRQQEEEAKRRFYEQRSQKAWQLVNAQFPVPTETTEDLIALAEMYLALHEVKVIGFTSTYAAADDLEQQITTYVGRLKRTAREAVLYHRHDVRSRLQEYVDYGDMDDLQPRFEKVVAALKDKGLPQVRQQYKRLLDFLRTQLAIETTENVTRLKAGQAPAPGDNFTPLLDKAPDNVTPLIRGDKDETLVTMKAFATAAEMAADKPQVTYGPMPLEKLRPYIAQHEEMKFPYKLEDEAGHEVKLPHD